MKRIDPVNVFVVTILVLAFLYMSSQIVRALFF